MCNVPLCVCLYPCANFVHLSAVYNIYISIIRAAYGLFIAKQLTMLGISLLLIWVHLDLECAVCAILHETVDVPPCDDIRNEDFHHPHISTFDDDDDDDCSSRLFAMTTQSVWVALIISKGDFIFSCLENICKSELLFRCCHTFFLILVLSFQEYSKRVWRWTKNALSERVDLQFYWFAESASGIL